MSELKLRPPKEKADPREDRTKRRSLQSLELRPPRENAKNPHAKAAPGAQDRRVGGRCKKRPSGATEADCSERLCGTTEVVPSRRPSRKRRGGHPRGGVPREEWGGAGGGVFARLPA